MLCTARSILPESMRSSISATKTPKPVSWWRLVQEDVPAGLNPAQLGLDAKALKPLLHDLRLAQCQRSCPRPHDQLFRQERNASRVVSITSWLCAAEMKSVSYWLGVRKMPESASGGRTRSSPADHTSRPGHSYEAPGRRIP